MKEPSLTIRTPDPAIPNIRLTTDHRSRTSAQLSQQQIILDGNPNDVHIIVDSSFKPNLNGNHTSNLGVIVI